MGIADWFGWKQALIVETIFFSLGLLQQDFYLGQLWFIINTFTLLLLLRATYSESTSGRLMAWYIYFLSIFTDILSMIVFGKALGDAGGVSTFVLVMAVFLLLPKPIFVFFLYQSLKNQGVDVKHGAYYPINDNNDNNDNNNDNVKNDYRDSVSNKQQYFSEQSNINTTNNNNYNNNNNNNFQDFRNTNSQQQVPYNNI